MKKVLLSLLAVAALVLSCQNYDDEFAALNTKIASLESQITSLAELRTAVTGVQSSISSLQTAVAAAQAAAEAADNADAISALATSVAAIAADLVDLQTAIDGATTEADLDALKDELETTLAALQALIETNSASIASLITSNTELKDALEELGVDVDSVLAANATFEGNLTITNDAELAYAKSLGNKVATIKGNVYVKVDAFDHTSGGDGTGLTAAEVNTVLSQMTYVVGNVKVDTDESLDLSALASITGDYIVIGHDVSDDALLSVGGDVSFDYDGAYTSNIQTAGNIFLVVRSSAKAATDGSSVAEVGTTSIDFTALTKATGVQSVTSAEADTHTSGSSLAYSSTEADKTITTSKVTTSVKIGQAPVVAVTSTLVAATTALSTVELHYAADKGASKDGLNPNGVAKLASLSITGGELSSVVVKAKQITGAVTIRTQLSTATSNSASVDLSSTLTIGGLLDSNANSNDISALKTAAGITLSNQTSFSAPALTKSTAAITLAKATSFSAPKLALVGTKATATADVTADEVTGAVSLPALTAAADVSFAKATSFSAIKASLASIDVSAEATTLDIGSVPNPNDNSDIKDIATLETINLHNQAGGTTVTLASAAAITSATVLGDSDADLDVTITVTNHTALVSLTLGGNLNTVSVADGSTKFTTLKTSGTIESLTVDNNSKLSSLTLGHTEDAENGASLTITDNVALTTFTTSVDRVSTFVVTGNTKLGSFDASSIATLPSNSLTTSFSIQVTGNAAAGTGSSDDAGDVADWDGLTGTYTALSATTTRAYGQSSLATLKPYIQALKDGAFPGTGGTATVAKANIDIDLEYVVDNTPTGSTTKEVHTMALDTEADIVVGDNASDYGSDGIVVTYDSSNDGSLEDALAEILKLQ